MVRGGQSAVTVGVEESARSGIRREGVEVDMENAYVTLIIAAAEKVKGRKQTEWESLRKYAENKRRCRSAVAEEYGTSLAAAKNLFLTLMFGGTMQSWGRRWHISEKRMCRTEKQREGAKVAHGFASDVRRARTMIVAGERAEGENPATTLQRCLSKMEEGVMEVARKEVEAAGFTVGTLIHDAIVVNLKDVSNGTQEENDVAAAVDRGVQKYVRAQGWRTKEEG